MQRVNTIEFSIDSHTTRTKVHGTSTRAQHERHVPSDGDWKPLYYPRQRGRHIGLGECSARNQGP
eukprot:scaffold10410_cov31-Tisochrysis_lutea.AAC.1